METFKSHLDVVLVASRGPCSLSRPVMPGVGMGLGR